LVKVANYGSLNHSRILENWKKPLSSLNEAHRRNMEIKVYVGGLSYDTTEEGLSALFTQAGTVKSVHIATDRDTGRSRGFAFVEMSTQGEMDKAIHMFNGKELDGRTLTVNQAKPREERGGSRGGGGYGGGGGGGRGGYGGGGGGGGSWGNNRGGGDKRGGSGGGGGRRPY
jgi:RNA recognition motif-containing protein